MDLTWWIHDLVSAGQYVELASWIFWVLFSITLHELGHGWAAIREGDDTPRLLGHMTANPIVHMGAQSLVMFGLCGIAWGAMPVNPSRFRHTRRSDMIVSAAGPAMNLLLALACLLLLTAWVRFAPQDLPLHRNGTLFLFTGLWLNLFLIPFNLLPIPPLDGAHVLAGFSRRVRALYDHPEAPIVGLLLFMAIFNMSPIGAICQAQVMRGAWGLADAAGALAGNPGIVEVMYGPQMDEAAWRLLEQMQEPGGHGEGPGWDESTPPRAGD
jgi:Zn-dependent protease